jgi:IclR family pca regulon transcriptional regulator
MSNDKDFLATFARGLKVIKSFANEPRQTISRTAERNGLSRSAARRFLLTLEELGYVANSGKQFTLTAKVLEFSYVYLSNLNYIDAIMPHLERLSLSTKESCSASVLDDDSIVYIARLPIKRRLTINLQIGARLPAYNTSMGRMLLSQLPDESLNTILKEIELEPNTPYSVTDKMDLHKLIIQARKDGFAIIDQELELGLRSVAAPVRNGFGVVLFAINISCHSSTYNLAQMQETLLPALLACTRAIEKELS